MDTEKEIDYTEIALAYKAGQYGPKDIAKVEIEKMGLDFSKVLFIALRLK